MAVASPATRERDQVGLAGRRERMLADLLVAATLAATLCLKLHHLDHTALTHWDEVFHAIVAQNVVKHPLTPTLVDTAYLSNDPTNWGGNHVWLHKPILPFWQIAGTFALLGVSTFSLRLPSALLSAAAAWFTYRIGTALVTRRAAAIAAALQAASPFVVRLVHGYQFADHVDVALLFWVEVGVYFLVRAFRTGSWRDVLLAGTAQGLAFLCKSYLAGIILGIALTAWLLPVVCLAPRAACRLDGRRVIGLLAMSIAVALPWQLYCLVQFPEEFRHEQAQLWQHIVGNVEGWAAPWDRVVFDYLVTLHGVFYTPILVAALLVLGTAVTHRHAGLWLLYAWMAGVIVPHVFVTTKTPSATLLALPPLLLLLGEFMSRAWDGEPGALAGLTGVLGMSVVLPPTLRNPGYGYPSDRSFGVLMEQGLWVLDHVAAALALAVLVSSAARFVRPGSRLGRSVCVAAQCFCVLAFGWLAAQTVGAAWIVTARNEQAPFSVEVGAFVQQELPTHAVLLCEEPTGYEHLTLMFYADRTCYPLDFGRLDEMAAAVARAGGVPYVVAYRPLPFGAVHVCRSGGPTVYRWR